MSGWSKVVLDTANELAEVDVDTELLEGHGEVQARLPNDWPSGMLFYFSAPHKYLGNQLSSYGGNLSYALYTLIDQEKDVDNFVGPDLILMGNNITIVHNHVEQPVSGFPFRVNVNLIEHEFHLTSGRDVSREQMMMVLVRLEHIFIRGSYFHPTQDLRLSEVMLDTAVEQRLGESSEALRVEQCHCPPNYRGNSCEDCAPGYYRSKTGPYLGYCVPCECNGHSDTCDVHTGVCMDCKDNTVGDHCELCAPGYHGDSTVGTPYDCLICACPLPIESNNFATSCEVSSSGDEISCVCKPGYYGNRCEVCDLGFYGSPETLGSTCRPCQCSGNIDPSRPGSCDSVTGDCVLCLNNTFGSACELCAPGFYGDAISRKDCKKCDCDECGTVDCNHETGVCECWPNTEYPKCDRCIENHWGFNSCRGCRPCNCGPASKSESCNLETGQCECYPGAGGLTCDLCEPGFWQYSSSGCVSCNCDEKYSAGAVCNPVTGQCECLPGVLGDKCDSCPHRWVFVKNEGCHACGPCVHSLLDTTDELQNLIDPIMEEMKDVSLSYFANKRLQNVNRTADTLKIAVDQLFVDPDDVDFNPLEYDVVVLEKTRDKLDRNSTHLHNQAETISMDSDNTRIEALEVEALIKDTVTQVRDIVQELAKLSEGLQDSFGSNADQLVMEAQRILGELQGRSFEEPKNTTSGEYKAAEELLDNVKSFEVPFLDNKVKYEEESGRVVQLIELLEDLTNNSRNSSEVADQASTLEEEIERIPVKEIIAEIEQSSDGTHQVLQNATDLLEKTKPLLANAETSHKTLDLNADRLQLNIRDLIDNIEETKDMIVEIRPATEAAEEHADFLKGQAELLDRSLADTRDSANAAVKAAKAYANIEEAINNASRAAQEALDAAEQATEMSEGVLDKTDASKDKSNQLLESATLLEQEVKELEPQLEMAKDGVLLMAQQNAKNSRGLDIIKKELDKLPLYSVGALAGHAANGSALANDMAERAKSKMDALVDQLPEDLERAKRLPRDNDDTKQAIKAAHSYADRVASILPDTSVHMDRSSKKESATRIIGTDVSAKIHRLQKQVAVARNAVKRIKLGIQFFDNTTLQLRNPDGIEKAATYTRLSFYFRTAERYGLLVFVGNEKGAHAQMKRALTDDYLALEIRGGRIVMIMDLGSGYQDIKHDTYVSDDKWHQVIVERTGKSCTLTVRTEDEQDSVVEGFLPGTFSVFNLNRKVSKFFVGGAPEDAQLPDTVSNRHFDGCLEDMEWGNTPVGLWDFVEAENLFEGCSERNQLEVPVPSNGLRFSGSGYAILPKKKHQFGSNTHIKIPFKTYVKDGLLFLIGKNNKFFALELEEGHAVLKYNLGSGTVVLRSTETYNDGEWHDLEAARSEEEAILLVDQTEVDSAKNTGPDRTLSTTNQIFVGGHPSKHNFPDVTNKGFEGCIHNMQIFNELIDLNKNKEALGVVNGCPITVARSVSFGNSTPGYVAMPSANLEKLAELTFKFKTGEPDALLFHAAADPQQSSHLTIALQAGALLMRSKPGGEIRTQPDVRYNDREWHYVTATKTLRQMRLDIDDLHSVEVELPVEATVPTNTPLYFGGVPEDYEVHSETLDSYVPFVGCLGDATVNNKFQNFAEATERAEDVSLASCPMPDPNDDVAIVIKEEEDEVSSSTPPTITTEADEDIELSTPESPPGPEPTPYGQCVLPVPPRTDTSTAPGDGSRFGDTAHSRHEFLKSAAFMGSLVDESTFALEFKTSLHGSGVLFYVAGANHKDFVGLVMQKGKIVYVFNCGTGSGIVTSQKPYNDGTWHRVVFSRNGKEGRLVIDDEEEVRGSSPGSANSVNVAQPFYVGGLPEGVHREAKNNLRGINLSFPGCIRNIEAQGDLLTARKPDLSHNVSGCSEFVEEGTYFSHEGGYLILYDKYNVGQKISIQFDIRPRNLSGVLLAVHGTTDYLILQLVDGKVVLSVDNGAGQIRTTYVPTESHYLCDGNWHTINVVKNNNIVSFALDGVFSNPGIGVGGVSSTNTKDPLYIGGLPPEGLSKKGVETNQQFVGCMRFLELKNKPQSFAHARVFGQVTLNTCPTI